MLTLVIDENLDLALLHHTDAAVCGSEILSVVSVAVHMGSKGTRGTYNTDDSAILLDVIRSYCLDECWGKEGAEKRQQTKANGHVAPGRASHG